MLIPWPRPGLEESDGIFKYESDVVVYNYTCQWPEFTLNKGGVVISEMDSVLWTPWDQIAIEIFYISGALPIERSDAHTEKIYI